MSEKPYNVLFLCTGNSARSIMAEAMLNGTDARRFCAFSAGSHPAVAVNPYALEQIQAIGYSPVGLRSKSWDEFAVAGAPNMDFVITVCDKVAGEACPFWPGQPVTANWSFRDPAIAIGTADEVRQVFATVCREIKMRLDIFRSLPLEKLDKLALQRELAKIGGVQS